MTTCRQFADRRTPTPTPTFRGASGLPLEMGAMQACYTNIEVEVEETRRSTGVSNVTKIENKLNGACGLDRDVSTVSAQSHRLTHL